MDQTLPDDDSRSARPDWLVGADEGASGEVQRARQQPAPAPVRLVRPQSDPTPPPARGASADFGALDLDGGARGQAGTPGPSGGGNAGAPANARPQKAWAAKTSSVPRLRLVEGGASADPEPAAGLGPAPLDEDDGIEDAAGATQAAPGSPRAARGVAPRGPAPVPRPALRESWWVIALDLVRTDRRVQIVALLVFGAVAAVTLLRPREDMRIPLRAIRTDPARFDNRVVTVGGRVGEVFAVGGGYAFFLHQGRDTLVVFTRSRQPRMRENVTIKGSISTGFLDGAPRQALFEGP